MKRVKVYRRGRFWLDPHWGVGRWWLHLGRVQFGLGWSGDRRAFYFLTPLAALNVDLWVTTKPVPEVRNAA